MTADAQTPTSEAATQSFEADVSRLLHLMVHSVDSDREIFVRELVSNAADAGEELRYELIAKPELHRGLAPFAIEITINPDAIALTFSDNGVAITRKTYPRPWHDRPLRHQGVPEQPCGRRRQQGGRRPSSASSASAFSRPSRWRTKSPSIRAAPGLTRPGAGRRTAKARSPLRRSRSKTRRSAARE